MPGRNSSTVSSPRRESPRPYTEDDYFALVDGRPRYEGVAAVLADRGIELPWGKRDRRAGHFQRVRAGEPKEHGLPRDPARNGHRALPRVAGLPAPDPGRRAGSRRRLLLAQRRGGAGGRRAARGILRGDRRTAGGGARACRASRPPTPSWPRPATWAGRPTNAWSSRTRSPGSRRRPPADSGWWSAWAGTSRCRTRCAPPGPTSWWTTWTNWSTSRPETTSSWTPGPTPGMHPRPIDPSVEQTIFSLGNGFLGMRGDSLGIGECTEGMFINGLHETWKIRHAESAFGLAEAGQTMVAAPDARTVRVYINDEALEIGRTEILKDELRLDFKDGTLISDTLWRTAEGHRVMVRTRSMVSFSERHLALFRITVRLLDAPAHVFVQSALIGQSNARPIPTPAESDAGELPFDPRKSAGQRRGIADPRRHLATGRDQRAELLRARIEHVGGRGDLARDPHCRASRRLRRVLHRHRRAGRAHRLRLPGEGRGAAHRQVRLLPLLAAARHRGDDQPLRARAEPPGPARRR